jgi:uncharacterized protein (DUF2252 family)
LRKEFPRSSNAEWQPPADRRDPVEVIVAQNSTRIPELVPVRHARMAESAFTFYRGTAAIMAGDLASQPNSGEHVQLCGDAHLSNFGIFASAERAQVFDVNDFDETLPGPWEWDLKRLAASFVIGAEDSGLGTKVGRECARLTAMSYVTAMGRFAAMPILDLWYAQLDVNQFHALVPSKAERKKMSKRAAKARRNNSDRALRKLTEQVDGSLRIRSDPPLLAPGRELASHGIDADQMRATAEENLHQYLDSIPTNIRTVLAHFHIVDFALKVVGVGSVGTRCFILLLTGRRHGEPFFLQIKEAGESVLQPYLPASRYRHAGRRVVEGRRMIQASGDTFLGWSGAANGTNFYWRQFRDMKGSADIATMDRDRLARYAKICGWTLAHGHARSGDPDAIHGYLGKGRGFSEAIADFSERYARQNDSDYAAFLAAISAGQIDSREL